MMPREVVREAFSSFSLKGEKTCQGHLSRSVIVRHARWKENTSPETTDDAGYPTDPPTQQPSPLCSVRERHSRCLSLLGVILPIDSFLRFQNVV